MLAVMREGSLSAAARSLGLTQPTLGRHIDTLEQTLGLKLFVRGQRGLDPTDAALDLKPHAEAMAAAAAALERTVSGEAGVDTGTVRITASEIVGCAVLPPLLSPFRAAHPGIVIELVTSNRVSNLLTREADIAVRMARPEQLSLVARRVGDVALGLYAHTDYVTRRGMPESVADLAGHSVVGFDTDFQSVSGSVRGLEGVAATMRRESFDFRSDSHVAQLEAIRAGLGIGGVQKAMAARDPDLVPILPDEIALSLEMWLAMHEDLRGVRPVRLMFDHLFAALSDYCGRTGT